MRAARGAARAAAAAKVTRGGFAPIVRVDEERREQRTVADRAPRGAGRAGGAPLRSGGAVALVDLPSNPDAQGVTFVRDGVPVAELLDELDGSSISSEPGSPPAPLLVGEARPGMGAGSAPALSAAPIPLLFPLGEGLAVR